MVEGKPYRYGLIAAGLCVASIGLFIMTQERPHIYATLCSLGVGMTCIGTVWSICQCYPKVTLAPEFQGQSQLGPVCVATEVKGKRHTEALAGSCGRLVSETTSRQFHSCPTLHLA